jgi:hypothetical protein
MANNAVRIDTPLVRDAAGDHEQFLDRLRVIVGLTMC